MEMRSLCLAFLLSAWGCGGDKQTGDVCAGDSECAAGLCVAGVVSGDDPVCTPSCGSNEDCPEGWTCSVATQNGVVVCRHGDSTPFGH